MSMPPVSSLGLPPAVYFAVPVLLAIFFQIYNRSRRLPGLSLPGPKGWPILGNIVDIPEKRAWLKFNEWKKQYGDIVGVTILGQQVVILNSRKVVDDLLEKRSALYSDRPQLELLANWGGFGWALPLIPYNDEMRRQRKMFAQCIGSVPLREYESDIRRAVLEFASASVQNPGSLRNNLRVMIVTNIARVAYGYKIAGLNDEYVEDSESLTTAVIELGPLGSHPIDVFPLLSSLPPIVFGKKLAKNISRVKECTKAVYHKPYERARMNMRSGVDLKPSIFDTLTTSHLNPDGTLQYEHSIKAVTGAAYSAGVDTIHASLDTFILAMMCYPEVQRKAQRCIDDYFKGERLPEFKDREALPYIDALLRETLRWKLATPLATPHTLSKDDEYNGFKLSAGSIIMPNSWACLHNEQDFPDPEIFKPERFLESDGKTWKTDVPDPRLFAFGYGRRVCPGRYLAENVMWTSIVTMLVTFNVSKPVDREGQVIEPDLEYDSGMVVSSPKPYQFTLVPRSQGSIELLNAALERI